MLVRDLYQKYQIMPQLATHMLRVAGVGKMVAKHWKNGCDARSVTKLCLLHDLGNIVKFDLQDNIDRSKFGQIENLKYWQGVQRAVWEKYGKNAHEATIGMLVEARLTEFVPFIKEEERLYFAEAREEMLDKASTEAIILLYGDCRVTPSGVVSYRERVNDLQDRYGARNTTWYDWTFWFEEWMQKQVSIDLNSITEDGVKTLFDELLTYTI
ncbi:MAG: hypothetical protein ACD_40C00320G0004 [uncultured bacterium]|nr:MAG: hypothetical protein ACD_40C00320G0004 [uncultured bacterium]